LPFLPLEEEVGNHFFHSTTDRAVKSNNGGYGCVDFAWAVPVLFDDTDT
jgi:hypothetical protein